MQQMNRGSAIGNEDQYVKYISIYTAVLAVDNCTGPIGKCVGIEVSDARMERTGTESVGLLLCASKNDEVVEYAICEEY